VYSIPAIDAIARMADRYFPTGVMPDKAFDLLEELAPIALQEGKEQLTAKDVEAMVARKTGIPIGEPSKEERATLLSLEDYLHKRVMGQDHAVEAVAKALRRARAGIGGGTRPMGSFMFLGPTGVGKTETAKALAEALFNDENAMSRIDMSEFRGGDALERLIGTPDGVDPGRLATLIREKPYGVLLLDEFEKSERNVHDLFLQVLDEGHFTDAMGKAVNAQNLIIIATSNAGADIIWQWEKEQKNVSELKRALIDHVIAQGIYRPEFLNRFDDVIVFHTLTKEQVREIAKLQLEALRKRLQSERMINVAFADDVVDYIAGVGYDPQFGGRPMRRAIQEKIEQVIADKILAGGIRSGEEFTMHAPDASPQKS
jgi:ATP-dependent Clp protease ATP-binding subunit ClpA